MRTLKPLSVLATWCVLALLCGSAAAQESAATSDTAPGEHDDSADLAKQVQNPLANLVSLPLQFNFNDGVDTGGIAGEDLGGGRRFFNLNVQPVIPFPGEKWNVISRTIIPINSVPIDETDSVFGLGDINLSLFWSPAKAAALTWGVGPVFYLPTASNPEILGTGKLSVGPTGVLFYGTGPWTMGGVASNAWSVAGDSDRDEVNFFFAQYFVNYNLGGGWALGTAPIITCDWTVDPGNRWTIPWGAQVSKVTHFGSRPANLLVGYYNNSQHPDGGPESQVRIQVNLLFPSG